jgi:ribonuclease R
MVYAAAMDPIARGRGRISVNTRGFGFLTLDDGRSAFVTPPDLNPFVAGDLVEARLVESAGRWSAKELSLVERSSCELIGEVVVRDGRPFLAVDRTMANTDWPIRGASASKPGETIVCRIEGEEVVPVRTVAPADRSLERLIVRHGIRSEFPDGIEASAIRWTDASRRDLRDVVTVTIDAPSSMDLDDALSVIPADPTGGVRVLVSIADVDAAVPEGSALDLEARRRGTSTYLAGAVLPMLPRSVSEAGSSLVPRQDRPCVTVELRIDPEGTVTSIDLYESVIRSAARLDYDSVAAFLDRGERGDFTPEIAGALRWLRTASARIGAVRSARGGLEIVSEEAYISVDRGTREPTEISARKTNSAHVLIERLMVAANEAVARWIVERGLPGMFRVHDEPDAERTRSLVAFAHNFGFELGLGDGNLTPRGLAALEHQFEGTSVAPAMRHVLGRALGPARYTSKLGPHFGLASEGYLHFTSPIRRYADLTVHRIVKRYLSGDRTRDDRALESLALHLNDRAFRSTKAEAERVRMLAARFFSSRIGARFGGNIVAIKPFGLVVQMVDTGVTGSIPIEALPKDEYRPDAVGHSLAGARSRFSIGDSVDVQVAGTDEALGRIDLRLA